MSKISDAFAAILADEAGAMMIETAFVLPALGMLSVGGFEASQMVARNTELQSAMAEATAISLAKMPRTQAEIDVIEDIVEASSGLADDQVTFGHSYRCGSAADRVVNSTSCAETDIVSEYIDITMTETYSPIWTNFGIGSDVDMIIVKSVQIA